MTRAAKARARRTNDVLAAAFLALAEFDRAREALHEVMLAKGALDAEGRLTPPQGERVNRILRRNGLQPGRCGAGESDGYGSVEALMARVAEAAR